MRNFRIAFSLMLIFQCCNLNTVDAQISPSKTDLKNSPTYSIEITTDAPAEVFANIAPLLYNKKHVLTIEIDDGLKDIYTSLFRLCSGGVPEKEPSYTSPGLFITDGCGHKIPFKATTTCFVNRSKPPLSASNWFDAMEKRPDKWLSTTQINALMAAGYGMNDHGYYNDMNNATDIAKTVTDFIAWSEAKYHFRPLVCVVPGGVAFDTAKWIQTWFTHGAPFYVNGSGSGPEITRIDTLNPRSLSNPLKLGRYILEKRSFSTLKTKIDALMASPNNQWLRTFGHNITDTGFINYGTLKQFLKYLESTYGQGGSDNLWVASVTDVVSYLYCRNGTTVGHIAKGTKHTFTLNTAQIPSHITKRLLTLVFTSKAKILEIKVNGYNHTQNGTLVNLELP